MVEKHNILCIYILFTYVFCLSLSVSCTVINLASDLIIRMRAQPLPTHNNALLSSYCLENHLVKVSLILDSMRYYPQRLSEPDTFYPVVFWFWAFGGFWDKGIQYLSRIRDDFSLEVTERAFFFFFFLSKYCSLKHAD